MSVYLSPCLTSIYTYNVELWKEEAKAVGCRDSILLTSSVHNQLQCQEKCEGKNRHHCVGISYSHHPPAKSTCYVCWTDRLWPARNHFGFYRRPNGKN